MIQQVLNDWVLVTLDKLPETTASGIFIRDTTENRIRTGTVKMTGPGRELSTGVRVPTGVEPGSKVAFWRENLEHRMGKAIVAALADHEEDCGLIKAADILYVIEE